ncbi:MAG TPA: TIGR03986 family CRISPR-associated RAMP protein [Ktedonobacteraceae bacterium]|jgi:CRISPR-associated protein (TIGR03986 family)
MTVLKPWPEHNNPKKERVASAPYNFVPLPEIVIPAVGSAEELPGHDTYDPARLSGYFDVTLTTRSPLYIRGPLPASGLLLQQQGRQLKGEQEPGAKLKDKPEFFHTGDEQRPVIPGSSLRGMLRALLEVVSYSKVQAVSERHLFFRTLDPTTLGKFYRDRMGGQVETGFLVRRGDTYVIHTCRMVRVDRSLLGDLLYEGTNAPGRVPRWPRQHARVWIKIGTSTQRGKKDRAPDVVERLSYQWCDGMCEGRLVITGDIPRSTNKPGKRREFVFLLPADDTEEIEVPREIIERFHDNDQVTQWQQKAFPADQPASHSRRQDGMLEAEPGKPGDPIFFLRESGTLTFIGRAQMFRLPYSCSPFDLVPSALRDPMQIDYAEALFGFVRTREQLKKMGSNPPGQGEKGRAYAGRVTVTDAVLQPGQTDIWLAEDFKTVLVPRILASPRPTTFQHYLTQRQLDDEKKLDHYGSNPADGEPTVVTIRGHKLYWHQGLGSDQKSPGPTLAQIRATICETSDEKKAEVVDTQHTCFKPLRPEVTFTFRVSFENLCERELGALCWTLHPRGEPGRRYCHHLGMGKPLGMGAVELQARLHFIDRAQRYRTLFNGDAWQLGIAIDAGDGALSTGGGEDLVLPDVLAHRTEPFEDHLLAKLHPDPPCQRLSDMRRVAQLLKLLEWPGYQAVENGKRYLETPPRPNTRYMKIDEYRERFVLPDPTLFDEACFTQKSRPGRLNVDLEMRKVEAAKQSLEQLPVRGVAGQIEIYYQQWQQLKSEDARYELARAIIAKVRRSNREAACMKKAWYQQLLASLPQERSSFD